jgi:hypothetical protein
MAGAGELSRRSRGLLSSERRGRRSRRTLLAGLLTVFAFHAVSPAAATSVSNHLLRYRATHSLYGEIGSYANRIDERGETVVVQTEIHLRVSVLGIVLHREDAERTERWIGDRLVAFHGITTVNGTAAEIQGDARGDGFEVTSPQGTVIAPARVRPSNPWSSLVLGSDTMMRTDTGVIEHVGIGPPKTVVLTIDGKPINAREYEIRADPAYKIWLDAHDVPVMFTVDDESGLVTFTLEEQL